MCAFSDEPKRWIKAIAPIRALVAQPGLADHLQSSYKLVEKPAEKSVITATQSVKAQRPQAAVQGITPTQPAPKHVVIKAPTLLNNFFAWVKSLDEEEPKKQAAAPSRNNPPRRDKEETPRIDNPARPEPKAQEPRKERPPRPPRVAIEKPALENVVPVARLETGEEGNIQDGRKRGRRGGKRERERREQLPNSISR